MDIYTATEEAYKMGFKKGYHAGRADSGHSSSWGIGEEGMRPCIECGYKGTATKFCPECGAAMSNPTQ